jgi:hypothetical protein
MTAAVPVRETTFKKSRREKSAMTPSPDSYLRTKEFEYEVYIKNYKESAI